MKAKTFMARQGDILIIAVDSVPAAHLRKLNRKRGRLVLAEGEATGHAHAVIDRGAELLESDNQRFLRVLAEAGVELAHEEHATIVIPRGDYEVRRQRQYAPGEIRQVAD